MPLLQRQTLIVIAAAVLFIYFFATPRSGSWTKRPHQLSNYDAEIEEPMLVYLIRLPFRILRIPLTVSAYFFELCMSFVVWSTYLTLHACLSSYS